MSADAMELIFRNLEEWKKSVNNPETYQRSVLEELLDNYTKTNYGERYNASTIDNIEEYRKNFPVITYKDIKPWLEKVRKEGYQAFLSETPITWVMTRGTTNVSKVLPVTPRHLQDIIKCGSRAVLNYSMENGGLELLSGGVLNLQFPSNLRIMDTRRGDIKFGFSSGTYAKLNPMLMGLHLIPRQEEIDSLDTDLTREGWENRYEYIYQRSRDEEVTTIIGVAPVQTGFGRYLKRAYDIYPKDIWDLKVIYSTSVAKIQTRYKTRLQRMYGNIPLVEMYTATEGAFGQQRDKLPYIVPNFETYFFEVETGGGVKMLHELERGEWGSLIVSTSMLPRYKIGDLIEAMGQNYYRVFGRDNARTRIEHILYRVLFGWFL
jgi:hypothetical protein